MLKRIFPILLVLAVFLTACGAPAAPTMNPADVQNTAVSAAWTMVAATEIAKPTATLPPPTEAASPTPLPTFTPEPLLIPTLPVFLPTATTAASSGGCLHPLNVAEAGFLHRIRLENQTGGDVTVSLNLTQKNSFGQCGSLGFSLKKNGSTIVNIPAGSWYAYVWIKAKNKEIAHDKSWYIGDSKSDDLLRLVIKIETLSFVGP